MSASQSDRISFILDKAHSFVLSYYQSFGEYPKFRLLSQRYAKTLSTQGIDLMTQLSADPRFTVVHRANGSAVIELFRPDIIQERVISILKERPHTAIELQSYFKGSGIKITEFNDSVVSLISRGIVSQNESLLCLTVV